MGTCFSCMSALLLDSASDRLTAERAVVLCAVFEVHRVLDCLSIFVAQHHNYHLWLGCRTPFRTELRMVRKRSASSAHVSLAMRTFFLQLRNTAILICGKVVTIGSSVRFNVHFSRCLGDRCSFALVHNEAD